MFDEVLMTAGIKASFELQQVRCFLTAASVKALARLAVSLHGPAPVRQDIDNPLEQAAFISLILLLHQSIHPSNPFLLLQATVGVVAIVQVYTFSLKMTSISTSNPLLISTDIPHSFLPIFVFSPHLNGEC